MSHFQLFDLGGEFLPLRAYSRTRMFVQIGVGFLRCHFHRLSFLFSPLGQFLLPQRIAPQDQTTGIPRIIGYRSGARGQRAG